MSKAELITFRVERGALVPDGERDRRLLNERGYRIGDLLTAEIRKPRNPRFHRMVFAIARMCAESIDEFSGIDAHTVLKRVQQMARIECDETFIIAPDGNEYLHIIPKSLSFANMSEERFSGLALQFCRFIADRYFPTMSPEAVLKLSENFLDER